MAIELTEIKEMMRKAKDEDDTETFMEGLRLIEEHHPDVFEEILGELQKMSKFQDVMVELMQKRSLN